MSSFSNTSVSSPNGKMKDEIKMAVVKRYDALVSNKAPKPTNFSNRRYRDPDSLLSSLNSSPKSPSRGAATPTEGCRINLENIVFLEDKLQAILSGLNDKLNVSLNCEEWWECTQDCQLYRVETLFKDDLTRLNIRQSLMLECIGVGVIQVLTRTEELSEGQWDQLLAIATNIQQSFLIVVNALLHRLPAKLSNNVWAFSLQSVIHNKQQRRVRRPETATALERHCRGITELLDGLASTQTAYSNPQHTLAQSHILNTVQELVTELTSLDCYKIRQLLSEHVEHCLDILSMGCMDVLPVVHPPYLPPLNTEEPVYTLVLDLDETLVHYVEIEDAGRYLVRPGCESFLEEVAKLFEVVVFTAALQDYADWVLDQLDPKGLIKYRLYRQHANPHGNVYVKDLSKLGRDLTKVIIVDNVAENFQLQPENGIFIKSWFDDENDTALTDLLPLLQQIAVKKVRNVCRALKQFRDQMISRIVRGEANPHLNLQIDDDSS